MSYFITRTKITYTSSAHAHNTRTLKTLPTEKRTLPTPLEKTGTILLVAAGGKLVGLEVTISIVTIVLVTRVLLELV